MNKLFDLRFVIGSFFTIIGLLLLIYSFMYTDATDNSQTINRWCGFIFIVFGIVMIILSLRKDARDEIIED